MQNLKFYEKYFVVSFVFCLILSALKLDGVLAASWPAIWSSIWIPLFVCGFAIFTTFIILFVLAIFLMIMAATVIFFLPSFDEKEF